MKINDKTIRAAYERHFEVYAKGLGWTIEHHIELWTKAKRAFEDESYEDFKYIYEDLRGYWQVFRSAGKYKPPTPIKIFNLINNLDSEFSRMKLSVLRKKHMELLWDVLARACEIKRNVDGPSTMAVSKFLHFWNPRLFVIVDKARIWDFTFKHKWLWDQMDNAAKEIHEALPKSVHEDPDYRDCDFGYYPAILFWCSQIMRENPNICPIFYDYLCHKSKDLRPPKYLRSYEAVAIEWLLAGLVEIPPSGVLIS